MNYLESVAYVESLAPTILNPDLTRFALFMEEHGRVQDSYPTIHIGGTNGKGSTVAIVDSVLRAAGLKVGRFTGPHLLRWNERFHFDGKPIDDETFAQYATRMRDLSEAFGRKHQQLGALTWFEFLTAIAFFYFADCGVDIAVFEVGLGGRWDATNVLTAPLVSCITTIDLDHTHILGDTIGQIAREKAGIIKAGVPVVTGTDGDALAEIEAKAKDVGARLIKCQAPDVVRGANFDKQLFHAALHDLALGGAYQHLNALLAATVISVAEQRLQARPIAARAAQAPPLPSIVNAISNGFASVYWPGRFQYVPSLNLLMDGAHNVAGARALRKSVDERFPATECVFVLSFFQSKNMPGAVSELLRSGERVFIAEAQTARAVCSSEDIANACRQQGAEATICSDIATALKSAQQHAGSDRLIVATGSFATVKESILALGWHTVEYGRGLTWHPNDGVSPARTTK